MWCVDACAIDACASRTTEESEILLDLRHRTKKMREQVSKTKNPTIQDDDATIVRLF